MNLKEQLECIDGITLSLPENHIKKDQIQIYIEGDENDGDYIDYENIIDIETMIKIMIISIKIFLYKNDENKWDKSNWNDNKDKYLTEEEISVIKDYIPRGYNDDGVHTITEISFKLLLKSGEVYNINY